MCLKAVDVREIDKANGTMIVLQLTPEVNKDMYLFLSGSRVINSDTSIHVEEDFDRIEWQLGRIQRDNVIYILGILENIFHPVLGIFLLCVVWVVYKKRAYPLSFCFNWDNPREALSIDQQKKINIRSTLRYNMKRLYQGKMATLLLLFLVTLVCGTSAVSIMPELKNDVLRFGYGVNFRYEGMLAHLFDRFYVVTGIEIL